MNHSIADITYLSQDSAIRLVPTKPDKDGYLKVPLYTGWRGHRWGISDLEDLGCCGPRQRPDRGLAITGTRLICVDCDNGNVADVKALIAMTQPLIYYPSFRRGHGHIIFDGQPSDIPASASWSYKGAYGEIKGVFTPDGKASYFALWNSPVLVQALKTRPPAPLLRRHYDAITEQVSVPSLKSPVKRSMRRSGGGSGLITWLATEGYESTPAGFTRYILDEGDTLVGQRNNMLRAMLTWCAQTHRPKAEMRAFVDTCVSVFPDMADHIERLYSTAMNKAGRVP